MDKEAAPVVVQEIVEDCPAVIVAGEAVKEVITGIGTAGFTVIVVWDVTWPAELLAVKM